MGKYNPNLYAPQSGRIIGEDGNLYNLVDLLRNIGNGNSADQNSSLRFKGAAIYLENGIDYEARISQLADDGCNALQLVTISSTSHATSNVVNRAFTDQQYQEVIDIAKSKRLKIIMKNHIRAENLSAGSSPNPTDPESWFASWKERLLEYAELAQKNAIEQFYVSNEFYRITTPQYYDYWADIVMEVRRVYNGEIACALGAVYDEDLTAAHLPLLDVIGFNLYPKLSLDGVNATVEQLKARWYCDLHRVNWFDRMTRVKELYGKTISVTEVGCVPKIGALYIPSMYEWTEFDEDTQRKFYEAALSVLLNNNIIEGFFFWGLNGSFRYQSNPSVVAVVRKYLKGGVV